MFPHAYSFDNGYLHPGEAPGHGVDIDEALAARYPYNRASAGEPAGRRHDVQLVTEKLVLHPDRLFPADERSRAIARSLYEGIKDLPIVSPHGHTDPAWFASTNHSPTPQNC